MWPAAEVSRDYLLMVVAVLGTTISPYLFFLTLTPSEAMRAVAYLRLISSADPAAFETN